MKIPTYIDEALKKRTRYALLLDKQCSIVDEWLDKNGIECLLEDTHGGVEIYANPENSEESIRDCIKNKEE